MSLSTPQKDKKLDSGEKSTAIASAVLADGSIVEMVFSPEEGRTSFVVAKDGIYRSESQIVESGRRLVPYSPGNNLLAHNVVLFASGVSDYESEQRLVEEIQNFIHRYVDVSPLFERIASYYVLFSWVHDCFNELPYLRVRGDTGSGKTRCLLTIGSLCYKPIFASGASTVSPLFRIIDAFQGTLIVDEGDFRFSDQTSEIIKILNNGNARGFPVLRSESVNGKEFDPRAYNVFGPKMIATRSYFEDRALESRCLTEETGGRRLRDDIPLNLGADWKRESQEIRNKLLCFRFRNFGKRQLDPALVDRTIEPRLAQIFGPLQSVIDDPEARAALADLAKAYHRELVNDRGMDTEAQILEVIRDLIEECRDSMPSVKQIADRFTARYADEYDRKITPKWVGHIVRRTLQLKTHKSHGVFVLGAGETSKLTRLYEKFGVATRPETAPIVADSTAHSGDVGDLGDFETTGRDGEHSGNNAL